MELELLEDLGQQKLTATSKRTHRVGKYKCKCGKIFTTVISSVKSGNTNSCGCYMRERASEANSKHKESTTKLYIVWAGVKSRVLNPNHTSYMYYGGKGVTICDEWLDYNKFKEWMLSNGYADGLSIDRIDGTKGYYPDNCRLVNMSVQARNTSKIRSNNKTGFTGVTDNRYGKFVAGIRVDNVRKHLGTFNTVIEAAKCYNNYVLTNNLEHTLNIIKE